MIGLYKEFTLHTPNVWHLVLAFVKANAGAALDKGTPLRVIVTAEERKRNPEQNRFYWGVVLRDISEQAWVAGRQFDKDTWHEYFADLFAEKVERILPDGRIHVSRKSTSDMSVGDFTTYLAQVQAHAANELGVSFDGGPI